MKYSDQTKIDVTLTVDEIRYICEWLQKEREDVGAQQLRERLQKEAIEMLGLEWLVG